MNTHYVLHLKESITIGRKEEGEKGRQKLMQLLGRYKNLDL